MNAPLPRHFLRGNLLWGSAVPSGLLLSDLRRRALRRHGLLRDPFLLRPLRLRDVSFRARHTGSRFGEEFLRSVGRLSCFASRFRSFPRNLLCLLQRQLCVSGTFFGSGSCTFCCYLIALGGFGLDP